MEKKWIKSWKYILVIYLGLYVYFLFQKSDAWGNVLSPTGALLTTWLIYRAYRQSSVMRRTWEMLMGATLTYAFADLLWLILSVWSPEPLAGTGVFYFLYLLPNVFIALAVLFYLFKNKSSWNTVQFTVDICTLLIFNFYLIFGVFGNRIFSAAYVTAQDRLYLFLYIATDLVSLTALTIAVVSRKFRRFNCTQIWIIGGIIFYCLGDLIYSVQILLNAYDVNTPTDAVFMLGFICFAHSALLARQADAVGGSGACLLSNGHEKEHAPETAVLKENLRTKGSIYWLLVIPAVLYLLHMLTVSQGLVLIGLIAVHGVLTKFIQLYYRNEALLALQIELNATLEERIAERTLALSQANEEMELLIRYDAVTGLLSRRQFRVELDAMIEESQTGEEVAVIFMDLDRFKVINDAHGHGVGDQVIKEVARRLRQVAGTEMTLSRSGGDEFIFALRGPSIQVQAMNLAMACREAVQQPIHVEFYRFDMTISTGIAVYPTHAANSEQLLSNSDLAMFRAKERKLPLALFSSELETDLHRRHNLEMMLRCADFDKTFELYYQPQIIAATGELKGVEALIRWKGPDGRFIPPSDFIPVAEDIDMIVPIGDWVLRKAVRQIKHWNLECGTDLTMAVNISPKQLEGEQFVQNVELLMREEGLRPEWLELEITEETAMKSESFMEEVIGALSGLGLSLAIDDFGTGYSSLSYLKRFDVDHLKIAKPLIDTIAHEYSAYQVCKAIIMMAEGLGLKTVAEGVEEVEQLEKLRELGCHYIQGYYFSKPLPASELEERYLK